MLYVFGGEKASGAEIVIERLISYNQDTVQPHLFISPGKFADDLIGANKPYSIIKIDRLKKLNRSSTSAFKFFKEALTNYFIISSKVIKYVKKNKISYIHANTVVPASYLIPAILYSKILFKKWEWIWSDHDLQYFSKLDNVFSALCVKLFNRTLAVSEAVKKKYGDNKKVQLLYNGLDLDQYKPNSAVRNVFRSKLNVANNIVLGIAATISPRKGQLELIEVFKVISKKHTNLSLLIAGGLGNDDKNYNDKVMRLIAGDSTIYYLGHVDNMIDFYCGCDIVINNSTVTGSEPLGTTIYEAMACEKIVIASNTGGTPEIITDKHDGFVFISGNSSNLLELLNVVVENYSMLNEVKVSARQKVKKFFSVEQMANSYNSILDNR